MLGKLVEPERAVSTAVAYGGTSDTYSVRPFCNTAMPTGVAIFADVCGLWSRPRRSIVDNAGVWRQQVTGRTHSVGAGSVTGIWEPPIGRNGSRRHLQSAVIN